jgi:eukaryotic-like serine/threonine-protein kinase
MGEVFLAYDDRLERPVAIKQVRRDAALDPLLRERLRREARAAARLSHPQIVQVYDILESAGDPENPEDTESADGDSIVMEYVAGRSIAEILRRGPLPLPTAVSLARQIASGLGAAHAAGLVHRDLKGENVLVDEAGRARILDFGLAKPLDGTGSTLTEHGAVLGTYRAMSPEQSRGEPADARSDLFSFGVLLYEMLTGVSPFAARTPVEILRRIDGEAPRPVAELRPETPAELAALVHTLLEKNPGRRPASAAEVTRRLQALAELPALVETEESACSSAFGEAPTQIPTPLRRLPGQGASDAEPTSPTGRIVRPQARRLAMALIVILAAASAVTLFLGRSPFFSRPPLRVAVLRPTVAAGSGLELAASGALVAELRGLLSLERLTPIAPSQIGDLKGSAQDAARAVSADEVLAATVEGDGRNGYISLQRVRAADGTAVWAERIAVPTAPENALLLANALSAALRRAYPDHPLREGTPDLEVRAEDYAEFVRIKQRLDAGRGSRAPELEGLSSLLAGSPRFLDGQLEAASVAATLYQDTKRAGYLSRGQTFLEKAKALAPSYPPLLSVDIAMASLEGDWKRAEAALAELEKLVPGDPIVLVQRCRLLQARGDLAGATVLLRQLVADRPTWPNLLWLADMEVRQGQVAAARSDLERALALTPGNRWPLAKLAELELLYGDLRRAERIYLQLIASAPHRSNLTNLGLVRYLLGDYGKAVESYRRALALDPGHLTVTLNLADAELALGQSQEAGRHYQQVLSILEKKSADLPLTSVEKTIQAQCLVHLGQAHAAVALALDAQAASPKEPEVAYQAALVFALAGENGSALALAKKAVGLGMQPRWLTVPGFESLRSDAAFRGLLPGSS